LLLVSDVIAKDIKFDKFVEEKLAPCLDHTSHRVIKDWEYLACTKEVNAPLETRLRCKLSNQSHSPTQMLIEYLADSVEMKHKTVQDLIAALKKINRCDVVKIITTYNRQAGMFNMSVHAQYMFIFYAQNMPTVILTRCLLSVTNPQNVLR